MTTLDAPGAAVVDAERVRTEDWPDWTVGGLNEAVTPEGRPVAVRVTDWAVPVVVSVTTDVVTEPPCWTVPAEGFRAREKSLFCPVGVQVGSPAWDGTLIASHAALVFWKSPQVARSSDLAELSVAVRYFL